jgi:hypothetical protein
MKKNSILSAILGVFALTFALSVSAQDAAKVGGNWELSMHGGQGTMTFTLTLQQDGTTFKGTSKGQRGESPVEGTVDGTKIHFVIHRTTPNGERLLEYNGTVDGDSMKGTAKFGENEREWSAIRSKPAAQ